MVMRTTSVDLLELDAEKVICSRDPEEFGLRLKRKELTDLGLRPSDELVRLCWDHECGRLVAQVAEKGGDLEAKTKAFVANVRRLTREQIEILVTSDVRLLDQPSVQASLKERLVGGARPENSIGGPKGGNYAGYRDSAGRPLDITR